jgi:predicted transcriptional regulator
MKVLQIKQFDEKDEEIVNAFISLQVSRPIARTLAYLQKADGATAVEIEKRTGLRQPEVSVAIKYLKKHDWINVREEKKPGRGRPYKIYSLKVKFNDIIKHFEKENATNVIFVEDFS